MRRLASLALLLASALAPVMVAHAAGEEDLADVDARIEYAYYTGDLRDLERLIGEHEALAASHQPWAAYQYAHAQFRRARLLEVAGNEGAAQAAARRCVQTLEAPPVPAPDVAEEQILIAACAGYVSHHGGGAIDRALDHAAQTAPHNPRLLLARAFRLVASAGKAPSVALRQQQLAAARTAANAFSEPMATAAGAPSWGAADAWLLVGGRAEALGDWLTAREAYERCLVLAPDYAQVRVRLGALAGRAQ